MANEIDITDNSKEKIIVIDDIHCVTEISERKKYEELIKNYWSVKTCGFCSYHALQFPSG